MQDSADELARQILLKTVTRGSFYQVEEIVQRSYKIADEFFNEKKKRHENAY